MIFKKLSSSYDITDAEQKVAEEREMVNTSISAMHK